MKICLLIPANKPIRPKTVKSLMDMIAVSPYEFLVILAEEGYTPSEKRNYGIVRSLNENCDYIFFVDDDMVFPPETLTTLIERNKDIIGGLYFMKHEPLIPVVELEGEIKTELFRVNGTGAGLLLCKTEIFKKIRGPWFETRVDGIGKTLVGDSYCFCENAREFGYEIWCDPSLGIKHLGETLYGKNSIGDSVQSAN